MGTKMPSQTLNPPRSIRAFDILWLVFALIFSLRAEAATLTFSNEEHVVERSAVRRLFAEEIKDAESIGAPKQVAISIAIADLNHDGLSDIVAFLRHYPFFCGTRGCRLVILIASPDGWQSGLDNFITNQDVGVSSRKTRGHDDILLGRAVLKWNGEEYKLATAQDH